MEQKLEEESRSMFRDLTETLKNAIFFRQSIYLGKPISYYKLYNEKKNECELYQKDMELKYQNYKSEIQHFKDEYESIK